MYKKIDKNQNPILICILITFAFFYCDFLILAYNGKGFNSVN